MAKLIKVSDTKAYRVEPIKINGKKMISVRQLYATKKDPEFKPAKQGMTLQLDDDVAVRVARAIGRMATDTETKFRKIESD